MSELKEAVKVIKNASYGVAFTGAGISVESGIAPFTGAGGLWNQYDPKYIEINFFEAHPQESWREMKKIFFNDIRHSGPIQERRGGDFPETSRGRPAELREPAGFRFFRLPFPQPSLSRTHAERL